MIKKREIWVVVVALLIAGVVACFFGIRARQSSENRVRILVGGELYRETSREENQMIEIEQDGRRNMIQIQNGSVRMIEASCPDQLCLHQGDIDHPPQMIVCLPNQVVVEFAAKKASLVDVAVK